MEQTANRAKAVNFSFFSRLRDFWASIQEARMIAAEFAALNALSDADLHGMGLTRAVLRRHLHQKYRARAIASSSGGWRDGGASDHRDQPR